MIKKFVIMLLLLSSNALSCAEHLQSIGMLRLQFRLGLIDVREYERSVESIVQRERKPAAEFFAEIIDEILGIKKVSRDRNFFKRHQRLFDFNSSHFLDEVVACRNSTEPRSENCISQIALCIAEARKVRDGV